MKATFVMFDFGFKNLLKIERPTSENNISGIRARISQPKNGKKNKKIACCFTHRSKYIKKESLYSPKRRLKFGAIQISQKYSTKIHSRFKMQIL